MTQLLDQAARDRIAQDLDATIFVEAGAGSGKTKSLVDRIVALVVEGRVELANIAAITFTEKAAAELRDRVREKLEERVRAATDSSERERFVAALDQVDVAAISTLHAFAQRILTEHPLEAGLPPNIEVLDEVGSELHFEDRWRDFKRDLLDDPRLEDTMLLAFAAGVRLDHLRDLALEFDRNWDLARDPERVPWSLDGPLDVDVRPVILAADDLLDARQECTDPTDTLAVVIDERVPGFRDLLAIAESPADQLQVLMGAPSFRFGGKGRAANWGDKAIVHGLGYALGEAVEQTCGQIVQELVHRLAVAARDFIVTLGQERRALGRLDFHDLLVLAREVLGGQDGPTVRAALRARYQRLLLDEFQDTDPIQIQIAALLASGDEAQDHWDLQPTDDGRLFFVGDPKQSIYRFRRADIALFLAARDRFGPVEQLTTNFRTSPSVLAWVNHVFSVIMQETPDSQPAYQPLAPSPWRQDPATGPAVSVIGPEPMDPEATADDLREAEAASVADAVVSAVADRWQVSVKPERDGDETWRDATLGDITILLPSRTSLPALERALEQRRIPYRAETSSLVYSTSEVRDLLLAIRAIADVTDELALLATLRSPLYGCGDDDLFRFRRLHGGRFSLASGQPDRVPADDPVARAVAHLRLLHEASAWLSPSQLLDRLCRDRRIFELGHATGRPRDLWRRLRFVIDHARAWEEAEGGTLREFVDWARFQASEAARVAESILPETDDDAVRIMTIHGSKGLEFPITIVSGASTRPGGRQGGVKVMWPPVGPVGIKVGSQVTTDHFEAMKPIDEQMGHDERIRLLYVACTRARDHLVVSLTRKERRSSIPDGDRSMTNAELLAWGARDLQDVPVIEPTEAELLARRHEPPEAHPSPEEWREERGRALAASARHRSVGASGVQDLLARRRDEGHDKDPLDIELPSWRKGRYGSAIGRAVHGVLQTIDLSTGEGVAEAVAGQAAAEGVVGLEPEITALVEAALTSPTVRAAAAATERWRETYVATSFGDLTLEGYLDLLYRDADGRLVVVDYKTTSHTDTASLASRTAGYRSQGAAYALAVEAATDESVSRVVFVFLGKDGAHDRELEDLDAAKAEVAAVLQDA